MLINTSLRDARLVGREAEVAVLDRVLAGAGRVAHLHGPGGIGKTALLRHFGRQARLAGREVVEVDGRLNDDRHRVEEAAALACVKSDVVLLIDAAERCRHLEPWLRDTFLPRLADGAVVVLASRASPDPEWTLDPGWARLFTAVVVRPLDARASRTLLAHRGLAPDRWDAVLAFAGGNPLVLCLAASAGGWEPGGDVLTTLLDRLVGEVPDAAHRLALDVLAQAGVMRESLLRRVLDDEDAATTFAWLRRQPFVESTADGLVPHDAVRAVLDADLRWRDPGRHEDLRASVTRAAEPDRLSRKAFEEGVVTALRTWRTPREFATSVLLRSHLVPSDSADPVSDLRGAIGAAVDALRVDPAGVKAHDALVATYIAASGTHRATARRLGVPYGTYRRHLAAAKERLVEHLLAR
ncbi:ATP-binding protein [Lentzea sp. HUAS12]|uniref:ATP-binding protein n=1 Tax=Lentzea sp. HUAS12 TaxID=2951806 RepID=UPI00209FA711|nr:ATP-binding protein [Lentzea sp. HUAS12]USX53748.1 ATP-binding protein [Lentzea sp. HUAS12]